MTPKEHELMVLMFARLRESIGIIEEILTSRGIVSADDPRAFAYATHFDDAKLLKYAEQVRSDYTRAAKDLGLILD